MKDIEKMLMGAFLLIAFVTLVVMIPSSDSSDNANEVTAEAIFDGEWVYTSELFETDQKDTNVLHLKDGSAGDGEEQSGIIITIIGCNDKNYVGIVDDRTHRSPPIGKGYPYRYGNVTMHVAYDGGSLPSVSQDINVEITNSRSDSSRTYCIEQQNESVKCNLNIEYKTKSNDEFETLDVTTYERMGVNKHYFNNVKISGSPNCNLEVETFGATIEDKMKIENFDLVFFNHVNVTAETLDISSCDTLHLDVLKLNADGIQIKGVGDATIEGCSLTVKENIEIDEMDSLSIMKDSWWPTEPSTITCKKIISKAIKKIQLDSTEIKCDKFSTVNYVFTMSDSTIKANELYFGNNEFTDSSFVAFDNLNNITVTKEVKFEGYNGIRASGVLNIDSIRTTFHGNEFIVENAAMINQKNKNDNILSINGYEGSEYSPAEIDGKIVSNGEININNFNYGIVFNSSNINSPAIEGKILKINKVLSISGDTAITAMKADDVQITNVYENEKTLKVTSDKAVAIDAGEITIDNCKISIATKYIGINVNGSKGITIPTGSDILIDSIDEEEKTLIKSNSGVYIHTDYTVGAVEYLDKEGNVTEEPDKIATVVGSSVEFTDEEPPGPVPPSPPTPPTPPAPPTPTPTPSGGDVIGEYGSLIFIGAIAALVVALLGLMLFIRRK